MENIGEQRKKLKQEIKNLTFFAKTLVHEHQVDIKNTILSKVEILKKEYEELKKDRRK